MISFNDWLEKRISEDSAFGRARKAAAQGLGPSIPDAEINSRNTAPAWQKNAIVKRNRKKKKKQKPTPTVHHEVDGWLQSVDSLKKDLAKLKSVLADKKQFVTTKKPGAKGTPSATPSPDTKKEPGADKDVKKKTSKEERPKKPSVEDDEKPEFFKKKSNPIKGPTEKDEDKD